MNTIIQRTKQAVDPELMGEDLLSVAPLKIVERDDALGRTRRRFGTGNKAHVVAYVDPDRDIRPQRLDDMIGQNDIKHALRVFMDAARRRDEPLDHVLVTGPAGLGKTTIANVIAHEMDNAPHLNDPKLKIYTGASMGIEDLESFVMDLILTGEKNENGSYVVADTDLQDYILFIDEIHSCDKKTMNALLPLLEDFRYNGAKVPPFTLIGATTEPSKIPLPLQNRFGINLRVDYYETEDIEQIIRRTLAVLCGVGHDELGSLVEESNDLAVAIRGLARRARGVPRNANTLARRTLDFIVPSATDGDPAQLVEFEDGVAKLRGLTPEIVSVAMRALDIDKNGLTLTDRRLLLTMLTRFHARPVGIKALASAMGESEGTIEHVIEPPLVRMGFIDRGAKGRELTVDGTQIAVLQKGGKVEY